MGNLNDQLKRAGNTPIYSVDTTNGVNLVEKKFGNIYIKGPNKQPLKLSDALQQSQMGTHIP